MSIENDVLVLGGAGVDTIVYVPELPLALADSYMIEKPIMTRAGQTGDFLTLGLAALGLRAHHLDLVGTDHPGDLVRALHHERGIALTEVPSPAGTKRAVNLVDRRGIRLSLYDSSRVRGDETLPLETVRALAEVSRHVHVCITAPCASALPLLHGLGVSISTDLHNWDGVNEYHEKFAYGADVVFVSGAALEDPDRTMHQIVERGRARLVICTEGALGARILTSGTMLRVAAVTPSAPVVDSNGAGDAFAAGFLLGWLAGERPQRCGLYGAIAGAQACTVPSERVDPINRTTLLERAERIESATGAW